jgi:hypothetical protein
LASASPPLPDPLPLKIGSLINTHDPLVSSRPRLDVHPGFEQPGYERDYGKIDSYAGSRAAFNLSAPRLPSLVVDRAVETPRSLLLYPTKILRGLKVVSGF